MRKLLNTLYVTTPESYLGLDGETVIIRREEETVARLPLHNFEAIVTFGYTGASPALMGACVARGIDLCFLSANGRFLARVVGESKGNVLLRREQYRIADDEAASCFIARNFLIGKLYNSKWLLERAIRDHPQRLDTARLHNASAQLSVSLGETRTCCMSDRLRGIEGNAAAVYFGEMDQLILQQKKDFYFYGRTRRPPLDRFNAMMSFAYTLLARDCASAIETAGLDAYVGFLHRDRPGRVSLAFDMMEELRSVAADRFVLTLVNKQMVSSKDFQQKENGSVILTDQARKTVLSAWQERKKEEITHPYLKEKIAWGLVPHAQALLLARFVRGDLDEYPPFLWK